MNNEGSKILKEIINEEYGKLDYENIIINENEFYLEFKSEKRVSEKDFSYLERKVNERNNKIFLKLLRISGVYYQGNKNNEMITRLVGKCFVSGDELSKYLDMVSELLENDHRKIGVDLDLFCFSDRIGAGLPLYTSRGTIIKDELQKEIEKVCRKYGFRKVSCPSLSDIQLFETSGHAAKFNDELFRVSSPKGHAYALKPVQCPHHTQIYASRLRSYKDLPIRYMESDKQYRAELQGAVGGLSRVYAITVEDGHSFCRIDQVKEEIINMCNLIRDFYSRMGLWDGVSVSLSVRDYEHPEKYIGSKEDWDYCEELLSDVANELNLHAKRCEGEAALYGPKIDFMFKDALGREIQIPTVQLDFQTPKRFELFYIDEEGNKKTPVMVHRAVLGSYERFLVLLLEQFKGVLPIWLSPVQVNILPVNVHYHDEYCKEVLDKLLSEDIRCEYDDSSDRLNKKIRKSNVMKNPITVIIGDNERDNRSISYRVLNSEETISLPLEKFIEFIKEEIKKR